MAFGARIRGQSAAGLRQMATPPSGSGLETIWHTFYDTQTFTSASTTRLTFFSQTSSDLTLSNMEQAGSLSDPNWFQLHDLTVDFLTQVTSAAGTIAGALNDLELLMKIGRPIWTLRLSSKSYGPYPLTFLHASGGPVGQINGTYTAPIDLQAANNNPSPGWNYFGSLVIPPKTSFSVEVVWAAAQTLSGNIPIRFSMSGVLSRRIV